jgi:hypothetical protein
VRAARLQPTPSKAKFKQTDFVDTIIATVLCELHFSQNQPTKSADDYYVGILKNLLQT